MKDEMRLEVFKNILLIISITLIGVSSFSQAEEEIPVIVVDATDTNAIFTVAEVLPTFPGGDEKMYAFLAKNFKYSEAISHSQVQGKTYAQFVVEKDGSLSNLQIAKSGGEALDKEVLRVIELMPNWETGKQRKKPVRVKYTLPISINLR